jgi:AcrR family transcriptional regulator
METRDRILAAATEIAVQEGFQSLTMDHVADRCGLSKGGLFHHFDSKDALMRALLEDRLNSMENWIEQAIADGATYPEAFIDAMFCKEKGPAELLSTLIAAVTLMPSLRATIQDRTRSWVTNLQASGVSPSAAQMLTFVGHGHYLATTLGVVELSDDEISHLRVQLKRALQPTEDEVLARLFRAALNQVEGEKLEASVS